MQKQSGNFLLQALLALSLVIAFMPFFAKKLSQRNTNTQLYVVSSQIETAQTAAKIYMLENANNLNYEKTTISGDNFSDTLEPYGLPLGFIPKTAFGQDISLIINKDEKNTIAYLKISGGKTTKLERKELIRRIGFYAAEDGDDITVSVPFEKMFSDIVQTNDSNPDNTPFLSDLNLNGFNINNSNTVFARNAEFETLETNTLSILGMESGKKTKNQIKNIYSDKSVFQSNSGEVAFSLTRGSLTTDEISTKTISKFGNTGKFYADDASVADFSMTAGSVSFYGPTNWEVKGNMITDNINFSVEQLEISSYINASRGQDVYINTENEDELEYASNSGISTGIIRAGNITLRDQTSTALSDGKTGSIILDIRPAGTSVLPDALINGITNDSFKIISDADDDETDTITCKSIITNLDGTYNSKSLSQNIICQYIYWERLEKRINIKQCLLNGNSNCD